MAHLGDFALETTIYAKFCTVTTTGAPTQLAGSPVVSVYENDDNTQITAGVTLNVDEDGVTGLNQLVIVATAANGYEAGKFYDAVITTGTVGGTSVVGYCVASFTIQAVSALRPTVAARTLDVSAGGEAGIDWANVGTPGSTVGLTATTVATVTTTTTATTATNVTTVNGLAAGVITAAAIATGAIDADALATDAVAEIADGVWDEDATAHQTQGTFGQAIGDPVADTNTIFKAVVTDATGATVGVDVVAVKAETVEILADTDDIGVAGAGLTALASQASVTAIDDFLDTEIAAILAAVDTEVASILALLDDARGEPGQGNPPVNPDAMTKIDYLYKAWRNRSTQTASEYALYADDGVTKDQEAACSDDGTTFVRAEIVTGL